MLVEKFFKKVQVELCHPVTSSLSPGAFIVPYVLLLFLHLLCYFSILFLLTVNVMLVLKVHNK